MYAPIPRKDQEDALYLPVPATIIGLKRFTDREKLFTLQLQSGRPFRHTPGQFVQVSVMGIGEAPISVSSPPVEDDRFELCVRAVGAVTRKLHTLNVGDTLYVRGPFGQGFEKDILDGMIGKHLLFIAGGLGLAPLRSLIHHVIEEKDLYKRISILYGCKTPGDRLFKEELNTMSRMNGNMQFLQIVDSPDSLWQGRVGVITDLIPEVAPDPDDTVAVIVGPPVMYKFVLSSLKSLKIPEDKIYMSLERRMKCGVGKCGHCQMEGFYVCQEGPVFNYAEVKDTEEVFL